MTTPNMFFVCFIKFKDLDHRPLTHQPLTQLLAESKVIFERLDNGSMP